MWNYSTALVRSFLRPVTIYLFFFSSTLLTIFSALFYFIESGVNNSVQSPLDAIYFTAATMTTVGYGDITPATTAGKILSILMMFIGTALYVSFTAVLSTSMIEIEQNHFKSQ